MASSFQTYKDMQLKAKSKNNFSGDQQSAVLPYMYEFYNVFAFSQEKSSGVRSVLARIIFLLLEGLNSRPRLPRFIVVILDKDLMEELDLWEPEGPMIKAFNVVTHWLAKSINVLIRRRRVDISDKNPGAVFGDDPRVVFVKMIKRAEYYSANCLLGKICGARAKFNESLNAAVHDNEQHIMNVTGCMRRDDFDLCGNLSHSGMKIFWLEVDQLMERFDRNNLKLLPTPIRNNAGRGSKFSA